MEDMRKMISSLKIELSENEFKDLQEREKWRALADAPFAYEVYQVNYDGQVYVPQQSIIDRNLMLMDHYSIVPEEPQINEETWSVGIWVNMHATIGGVTRHIKQYGTQRVNILKGKANPVKDAIEQAIKSAVSDGMKKCSSWFGIASHVYRGDVTAIKKDKQKYNELVNRFKLDPFKYPNGIPLLPDKFKSYYESMGWTNGIFFSDAFGGNPQSSGSNNKQLQSNQATNDKVVDMDQRKNNPKYVFVDMKAHANDEGEKYYEMIFRRRDNGKDLRAYAISQLIDYVESVEWKENVPCHISTVDRNGRLILTALKVVGASA